MKVLLYTEDFPAAGGRTARHSGIGRYLHDLASALAARGRAVTVLAPRAGVPGEEFNVQPLPPFNGRLAGRALKVRDALKRGAGHLVLAGDPLAHRVLALGGAPRGVPVAPVLYGTELRALAPALRYEGVSPLKRLQRKAWRGYFEKARARIVISRYTAGALDDALGRPTRSVIVYPAIAPGLLAEPLTPFMPHGVLRLLVIGRISERKNQLGILKHVAAARAAGLDARVTLMGNVDEATHAAYARDLDAFVERERAGDWVRIVREASDAEKVRQIDASDAVVALSRTVGAGVEGFGITAIEAGARGRPVIVSTEGGMTETIVEGKTGFAVSVDDVAAFNAALRALSDPERRAAMGAAGREHVGATFTREEMARRFEEGLA